VPGKSWLGEARTASFRGSKLLRSCDADGLKSFDTFGLGILRTDEDRFHCAILFDRAGTTTLLHLAWNYRLSVGNVETRYWWAETGLLSPNRKLLAVIADRIATAKPRIPYGLDRDVLAIEPETGKLIPGPEGKGLTCAAFILAVFESAGFKLLSENQWPEDANRDWQTWIVANLADDTEATTEQVAAVARDIGSRRFTPTEVVGSATVSQLEWPISFERAQQLSREIQGQI
jgi:hypothetical protein